MMIGLPYLEVKDFDGDGDKDYATAALKGEVY